LQIFNSKSRRFYSGGLYWFCLTAKTLTDGSRLQAVAEKLLELAE
jgi:hypothetical protein